MYDFLLVRHCIYIALSGTVFELLDVEKYRDLEIWVRGQSRSLKLVPFKCLHTVSYSPSIVTVSFARYSDLLVENRKIFIPHLYLAPPAWGDPVGISWRCLMLVKLEWLGYCMVKKLWRYIKPFSSDTETLRTDGQTDRQTDRQICYINIARQYADARWKLYCLPLATGASFFSCLFLYLMSCLNLFAFYCTLSLLTVAVYLTLIRRAHAQWIYIYVPQPLSRFLDTSLYRLILAVRISL